MRRTISFLLGMVFGIVFLLSSIGIVAYVGVAIIKPNDVYPESEPILGGLSDTTILKLVQDLAEKYKAEASGIAPDGGYYTVGDFVADYSITIATDLPQDVKDMPLLQYFTETDAEGDTGLVRAMKEVKVSAILSLANFIQGEASEEGKVLFDEETIAELSNYTLYEMIMDEEKGVNYVLQNVKLAQVVPDAFPEEDSDNKLMWAIGQTEIGKAIEALTGDNNLFLQLSEGGALASLGSLQIVDIVGDDSPLLSGLLTHTTIADLINENGELVPDTLLKTLELGVVLGLQKNQVENVDYTELNPNQSDGLHIVLYKDDTYLMSADGGQTCFEAQKGTCPEEDSHYCGYECFDYVWYETVACEHPTHITDADHLYDGDICVDGVYYQKASSLYNIVANLDLTMLVGGDSDALLNTFMNIPLGELLGQETDEGLMNLILSMSVNDLMAGGYNTFTLGDLLQFNKNVVDIENYDFLFIEESTRVYKHKTNDTYAVSNDAETLYEACLDCTEEHDHTAKCFDIVWYNQQPCEEAHDHAGEALVGESYYAPAGGIFAQLASYTIGDITSDTNAILDEVMNVKLQDLLGQQLEGPLAALGDLTIAQLVDGSAFDTLYVGAILGYSRKVMDESAFATDVCDTIKTDGTNYIKLVDEVWYLANINCTEEHDHNTASCYDAVWYTPCTDGCTEEHDHETIDGKIYTQATGIAGLLADKTIADFSDINELIGEVTIRDVLGDNIPSMLEALADTPISQLATEIDGLKIGQILGYTKQGDIWYNCTTDHVHGTGCAVAEGIVAKLADNTIADLSNMQDIVGDLTIRDVLGDNIPSMLEALADTPISQLATEIDGLKIGQILGYTKQGDIWYNCTTDHIHGTGCAVAEGIVAQIADNTIADLSNMQDIVGDLTIRDVLGEDIPSMLKALADTPISQLATEIDTLTLGAILGYTKQGDTWYNCETDHVHSTGCVVIEGLMAKFADKKITELTDIDSIISDLTLQDVLGENIPSMLKALADTPISQLATEIDTLTLGAILGYTKQGDTWYNCETDHVHGTDCTVVEGLMTKFADKKITELTDIDSIISDLTLQDVLGENVPSILSSLKDTPISQLATKIETLKLGEMLGYTLEGEIWYNCDTEHTHNTGCVQVDGLMAKLAGKTIADLGNLDNIISDLTLEDVLGENIPAMLKSIKDTPVSQLSTAIETLTLGEMMGYTLESGVWYDCDTDHAHNSACTKVSGLMAKLVDKAIADLGNLDDIISDLTLADVLGNNVPSILASLKNTPISQLSTAIDGLKLGEMMGYTLEGGIWYDCDTDHTHNASCTQATGMMAKLANKTVADLGNLESTIQSFTLADVLGDNVPSMLASIKDTPISDIGTAMDSLKLGEVMGYSLQGTVWYDCDTDHTHGAGCTVVDGINGALVDIKIGELGNGDTLKNAVNTLTLAELGIGSGNAMLEAVGNVPLLEVGNEINNLQMGVAMGYTLQGSTWYDCDTEHTHGTGCTVVDGVNAKIANLKVNEMGSGLNGVMTSLTIGDLVDSGMMTLEEDNQYKLDIIFCNDNTHTTTVTVPFVGTTTVACDLAGYLQWKNVNTTGTAKQFFEECHSGLTAQEIEQHRGQWKACTLDNFVNGLLGAI